MIKYIKKRQKQWEKKWRLEAELKAKKEAERVAIMEAEIRKQEEAKEREKLLLEQQENERLRQKYIQKKEKLAEQRWDKQFDVMVAEIKHRCEKEEKLKEIKIIIQNREPALQELDWDKWLANPLNQELADLDYEHAMQMFKHDNLMAKRRHGTRGSLKNNYALSFSGDRSGAADSYATTTFNPDTYSLYNGFTISFWVRPDERMNQTSVILGSKSNSPESRFKFGIHSNGNINVGIGGTNVTGIDNPMEVGQWYNWVITYTGDDKGSGERKVRMWINNDPRMTSNTNTRWANQTAAEEIYFGGRNTDGSYTQGFACALSRVAIYNVCKDSDGTFANEVYNGGVAYDHGVNSDLVGYWKFNKGNGTTIKDHSGNGNHGTFGVITGDTTAYPTWGRRGVFKNNQ
jgi:hypothetical protein